MYFQFISFLYFKGYLINTCLLWLPREGVIIEHGWALNISIRKIAWRLKVIDSSNW